MRKRISVELVCKACAGTGQKPVPVSLSGQSLSSVEKEQIFKLAQGICLGCNGLGIQVVEKLVDCNLLLNLKKYFKKMLVKFKWL